MSVKHLLSALVAAALSANAWASDLVVHVTTPDGAPLPDAVAVIPAAPGAPALAPGAMQMAQQNKHFVPFVLIVPVGATVVFPNLDKFRHHVYSFSKGNKFELDLYGREDKRSVTFKTVGVAALGCNIHDMMVGFIRVVDTPWAAKTAEDGRATITNAPQGKVRLSVWHPYASAADQTVTQDVTISPDTGEITIVLAVSRPK